MNILRFNALAEAYGADLRRWPAVEFTAASALAAADPASTSSILANEAALDALLARSPEPRPSIALRDAIIAAAPRSRGRTPSRRWTRVGLSVGLAAASIAGVLTGVATAPTAASHLRWLSADTASEAAVWLGEPSDVSEG